MNSKLMSEDEDDEPTLNGRDPPKPRSAAVEDIAFLARSKHRVVALDALAEEPHSREELLEITDVSSSTIRRTIREFEGRSWVSREGRRYEATQLGRFVAAGIEEIVRRIEVERKLRDVWELLPIDSHDLTVKMFSDAKVTLAKSSNPYGPVDRFLSLLENTDRFRFVGFDMAIVELCKDEVYQHVVEGMRVDIVDPPSVSRYIIDEYPDYYEDIMQMDKFSVRVHDDLPDYGIILFDERVGITAYEADSGAVRVLVDTDDTEVREWAESKYESYLSESRPLDSVS